MDLNLVEIWESVLPVLISIPPWVDEYFRPIVLSLVALTSIYVFIQKTGAKIEFRHAVTWPRTSHDRISSMVLANCKDNTISIWSITQLVGKNNFITLKTFDSPLILKPYESASVNFDEFSEIEDIGEKKYTPELDRKKIKIVAELNDQYVICKPIKKSKSPFESLKPLKTSTFKYNNFVYDKNVKYFLTYVLNGKSCTAFIENCGYISNEWGLEPNMLRENEIDPIQIQSILVETGLHDSFENYVCVSAADTKNILFNKSSNQFSNRKWQQ